MGEPCEGLMYSLGLTIRSVFTGDFDKLDPQRLKNAKVGLHDLMVALIALIVIAVRLWRRWREKRALFIKPAEPDSPYIAALKELENIRKERLWQNNQMKLYYTRITDVLREYIEARFALQAMEKTSAEILTELIPAGIDKSDYNSLKELLEVADLVKFAKYIATESENENAIPAAIRFISSTAIKKEE